ncbi:hypothetical protein ABW20_dc0109965 [Dactylellina cionopaga]|nr:hypothetical protein ABW20_dc0109965 [Dactylellina cionopaga]
MRQRKSKGAASTTSSGEPYSHQLSADNAQPSGFSRLPTEILLQIVGYLLTSATPIIIDDFSKQDVSSKTSSYSNFINRFTYNHIGSSSGLFLTSRNVSDAALTVLYTNKFILKLRVNFSRAWLLSIGAENRNRITSLQIGIFSPISQTSWQHSLKRELVKLGDDFAVMKRLRRVEYLLEWIHGRDMPSRDAQPDMTVEVERSRIVEFHESLLEIYEKEPKRAIRAK